MRVRVVEKDAEPGAPYLYAVELNVLPRIGEQLAVHTEQGSRIMRIVEVTHIIEQRDWYKPKTELYPDCWLTVVIEKGKP